jgi:hypothetical protein
MDLTPAQQRQAEELARTYTVEELEKMRGVKRDTSEIAEMARFARENDSPEGYEVFHELIFGVPQTEHSKKWIRQIYKDHERGGGTVIFAHRDSAKTTDITQGFAAFRIGQEPLKSNVLLQVSDEVSNKNSRVIGRIIAENPRWRTIFPNIMPEEKGPWGVKTGFYVRDLNNPNWDIDRTRFSGHRDAHHGVFHRRRRPRPGEHPFPQQVRDGHAQGFFGVHADAFKGRVAARGNAEAVEDLRRDTLGRGRRIGQGEQVEEPFRRGNPCLPAGRWSGSVPERLGHVRP